jgi:hypothetical protein
VGLGDHLWREERTRGSDSTYSTLCRLLSAQVETLLTSTLDPDDWRLLASTARREGVAPLLHYILSEAESLAGVPPDVQADLRRIYYATTARNLLIYRELSRILNALSPLPVIVLKGAALAATIYPNIGLRPMGDLDLLVPENRLAEAVAHIKALGYVEPYPEMADGFNTWVSGHVHLQGGRDVHLAVELHWTLVGGDQDWRSPSLPWFWTQTEAWKMEGGRGKLGKGQGIPSSIFHAPPSIFQLTPTAHLLYLCAHLMLRHGEARSVLRWFYDIYLLVERERQRIQWDELVSRAREFRWVPAVYAALLGASDRFCGPLAEEGNTWLPTGVMEALAEASDSQASQLVARRADGLQTRVTGVVAAVSSLSPRAGLRFLLAVAIPSPVYIRWRYKPSPAWLWPLCYPYRWLDILRDGLATLWKVAGSRIADGRSQEERTDIYH